MQKLAQQHFKDEKRLFVIIDDTLIKKIYVLRMQGSGQFFDTKIGRRITAFRLVAGMIEGRKVALPFECSYLFSKDVSNLITKQTVTKDAIAKAIVMRAIELFPNKKSLSLHMDYMQIQHLLHGARNEEFAYKYVSGRML
jgi:hypothetical protein